MKNELYTQGEALLAQAERQASHAQVYISFPFVQRLELVNNKADSFTATNEASYTVLVHVDGRAGISAASRFSPDVVERALAVARASAPKEYFYGLPEKERAGNLSLYDKKVASLTEEEMLAFAEETVSSLQSDTVNLSSGSITKEVTTDLVFTSEGIQQTQEETSFSIVAECIAREHGKVSSAWDYHQSRSLFPIAPFFSELGKKTADFLQARPLREKGSMVILKPEPFAELLDNAFLPNLNGKNVEKGKSLFVGKRGQTIVSPIITISDDGLLPHGLNSRSVDLEGTPTRRTPIFTKGVLNNFIYDYNTAMHAGVISTGNAGLSSIDFTNVIVDGEYHDVRDALIIDSVIGAHTADELSTDFSVTVDRAYILQHGDKTPVNGFMISGKMIEALQKAVSLGKKREVRNGIYTGALATTGINVII